MHRSILSRKAHPTCIYIACTLFLTSHNSADWVPFEILIQRKTILDKDGKSHAQTDKVKCLPFSYSTVNVKVGTSLVVQWLRLHAPNAGGLGSIPGRGTRSHML